MAPRRSRSPDAPLAGVVAAVAVAVALAAPVAPARAGAAPADDDVRRGVLARAIELLEAASAAKIPPRRPPTPVPVRWKAKRLAAIDLGAPLVAMTSGDLDGDGRAELIAVTEREVIVLAPTGRRGIAIAARAALPAEPPAIEPRDVVAAASVAGRGGAAEVRVRTSSAARGARYVLDAGALREVGPQATYPLCADRDGELAPGRNYYERAGGDALPLTWPSRYWAAACRAGLVDREGRALRAEAVLGAGGALAVTVAVRCDRDEAGCVAERTVTIDRAGVAFTVADVDRDGRPEVITSAASAPGDADAVTVHTIPAPGATLGKPVFTRSFSGGVGGVAADDLDGDGDVEVIAAVRLPGAERVDLWLLD